jgi:hypothetical protein
MTSSQSPEGDWISTPYEVRLTSTPCLTIGLEVSAALTKALRTPSLHLAGHFKTE